nr:PPC domain-containing protein [uncultured Duganella sp.]
MTTPSGAANESCRPGKNTPVFSGVVQARGDADLYVKLGSQPTTSSYLKKSDGSTTTETISIASPAAGTYYVLVYGYKASSGVSLVASYK